MQVFIRPLRRLRAFTLIELLTVMAVIAVLAGLILSISGYVTSKAAKARAQSEIAALGLACENYKTDNGAYPEIMPPSAPGVSGSATVTVSSDQSSIPSDNLDPRTWGNPSTTDNLPAAGTDTTYAQSLCRADWRCLALGHRRRSRDAKLHLGLPAGLLRARL